MKIIKLLKFSALGLVSSSLVILNVQLAWKNEAINNGHKTLLVAALLGFIVFAIFSSISRK